jgi:hypothetical protein
MKRRSVLLVLVLLLVLVASGCATSFTGSAFVGGPSDCESKCGEWGMKMAGMIALGEYSDACVCLKPGVTPAQALQTSAGGVGAVAGVMMQQQRQQQQ